MRPVDSLGLTPHELRTLYVWLPTVEQMLQQIEKRSGLLFHAGRGRTSDCYEAIVFAENEMLKAQGSSLRQALAEVLCTLISGDLSPATRH